jgi:hypothetical protein
LLVPQTLPELRALVLVCPICGWRGHGSQARALTDEILQCPRCHAAAHALPERKVTCGATEQK